VSERERRERERKKERERGERKRERKDTHQGFLSPRCEHIYLPRQAIYCRRRRVDLWLRRLLLPSFSPTAATAKHSHTNGGSRRNLLEVEGK
jgi:hypothetical protein